MTEEEHPPILRTARAIREVGVSLLLGGGATFYVAGFVALLNALQWTYGQWVMSGDRGATDKAPFDTEMEYRTYTDPTYVDGAPQALEAIQLTYNNGGYTYYKLRDLGQALGFNVGWDPAAAKIFVETDKPYDPAN